MSIFPLRISSVNVTENFIFCAVSASRGLIRSVIKHCLYCKREKAAPVIPFMANGPLDRLCFNEKPFTKTGMDHLAPYQRKLSKGTRSNQATVKLYIVRFTCLSTRALHLEIAGDLSTDSFILSLRQFLARRGTVKVIRSDNGTNFVGASTVLKRSIKALDPAKSIKRCLRFIIREKLFTAESLATFICEVESIM